MFSVQLKFLMKTLLNIFMPFFPYLEAMFVTNDIRRIHGVTSRVKAVLMSGAVSLSYVDTFKMLFLYIK